MLTLKDLQELKKKNNSDITLKEFAREAKITPETIRNNVKALLEILD